MKIKLDPSLSKLESDYCKLLEDDSVFTDLIFEIRKAVNIPLNAYIFTHPINKSLKTDIKKVSFNVFSIYINLVLKAYFLPSSWFQTMLGIILFNYAIEPQRSFEGYEIVALKDTSGLNKILNQIDKSNNQPEKTVEIVIQQKITFADLIEELKQKKVEIENLLNRLDSISITKSIDNIDLYKLISELSAQKLSDQKIADNIRDNRNEKISFELDRKTINTYKKRYEKRIAKIKRSQYYLQQIKGLITKNS